MKLFNFLKPKHSHKWQVRGENRFGLPTYRLCLKCRISQQRVNNIGQPDMWDICEPKKYLDSQFDSNDKYIFNH